MNEDINLPICRTAMKAAIGNAMRANVLMRVLPEAIWAAGIVDDQPRDVWYEPQWVQNGGDLSREFSRDMNRNGGAGVAMR